MEPDFVMQNGGIADHPKKKYTADEKLASWTAKVQKIAKEKGLAHVRITRHPISSRVVLAEAWKTKPESEGPPRWQQLVNPAKRQAVATDAPVTDAPAPTPKKG